MVMMTIGAALSTGVRAQTDKKSTAQAADSTTQKSAEQSGSAPFLDAEVKYRAKDSLAFDFETKKMFLFGDAEVTYGDIKLTAYAIELDMDSTLAYAYGQKDSLGV